VIEFDLEARAGTFRIAARGAVESGIVGLFGPSGAGKSTLLHALAGLIPIEKGTVHLDGRVLADAAARIHLPPEARRVGVVFQDGRLFPHLGVEGNLRFGARAAAGAGAGAPAFAEVVGALDLGPLLGRAVAGLSGGERQRVALGRALLAAPRVLLLDEPLASIDRARRGAILPYLRRLPGRFGIPLLHVSHDLAEMLSLTDRLILLDRVSGDRGEVQGAGSYRDLALRPEWLGPESPLGRVNVLAGEIAAVEGSTCRVRIGGIDLAAVGSGLSVGEAVTVTIGAEEIALAAGEIGATSIQNRLSARVLRRTDREGATVVELRIAATAAAGPAIDLLVEVTTRAADQLALADGRPVTALLKASAVRIRGAT
jgi:molybdate transport system ATP-binding protein